MAVLVVVIYCVNNKVSSPELRFAFVLPPHLHILFFPLLVFEEL